MTVYILSFTSDIEDADEEQGIIGIYSTPKKAEAARRMQIPTTGINLWVDEYTIDA
jgi:hypothetical protein